MKSILFIAGRFGIGGVEKVTVNLANEFMRRGYRVGLAAFQFERNNILDQFNPGMAVVELTRPVLSCNNVKKLRGLIREYDVDIVINQWAPPFSVSFLLMLSKLRKTKLFAVHHTQPGKGRMLEITHGVRRLLVRVALGINAHLVYLVNNAYVLLSPSFTSHFKRFAFVYGGRKLVVIPDPVVSSCANSVVKDNVILYVGRLSLVEKRVDRIIDVWKILSDKFTDWTLEIVGDGADRHAIEEMAARVPRVKFCGFQNPTPYYARAKILLLASEFEGFGMVLVEAMFHGCIPICLGSYSSAYDIICPGYGRVIDAPFDACKFAQEVERILIDETLRQEMSKSAIAAASRYDVRVITDKYIRVMGL